MELSGGMHHHCRELIRINKSQLALLSRNIIIVTINLQHLVNYVSFGRQLISAAPVPRSHPQSAQSSPQVPH